MNYVTGPITDLASELPQYQDRKYNDNGLRHWTHHRLSQWAATTLGPEVRMTMDYASGWLFLPLFSAWLGLFSVSGEIHRTLTWTTGSLTCVPWWSFSSCAYISTHSHSTLLDRLHFIHRNTVSAGQASLGSLCFRTFGLLTATVTGCFLLFLAGSNGASDSRLVGPRLKVRTPTLSRERKSWVFSMFRWVKCADSLRPGVCRLHPRVYAPHNVSMITRVRTLKIL